MQNRLLKFFENNYETNLPLDIKKTFIVTALIQYYEKCKSKYLTKQVQTRANTLTLLKIKMSISIKNAYYIAIKYFNMLPNKLKILTCNKKSLNKNLKSWINNLSI